MEWIRVKDRLPPEGEKVLTLDYRSIENMEYRLDYIILITKDEVYTEGYIWACRLADECDRVTHWMPLPELPKDV